MNTERIILRNTEKINDDGTIELIQQETETYLFSSDIEITNVRTNDNTEDYLKLYLSNSSGESDTDWLQFRKTISNGHKVLPVTIKKNPHYTLFKLAMLDSRRNQTNFEISFDLVSVEPLEVISSMLH